MINDELKNISKKIVSLEKKIQQGGNVKKAEAEIEEIMCSLSIEEILEIDDYIESENLLTF